MGRLITRVILDHVSELEIVAINVSDGEAKPKLVRSADTTFAQMGF